MGDDDGKALALAVALLSSVVSNRLLSVGACVSRLASEGEEGEAEGALEADSLRETRSNAYKWTR